MKKTKTIEVNICDQCGQEVGDYHIKTCVACKKDVCPNCAIHFNVEIVQIRSERQERADEHILYNSSRATRSSYETGWRGTYCGPCGNGIDTNLEAAGFVRYKPKERLRPVAG